MQDLSHHLVIVLNSSFSCLNLGYPRYPEICIQMLAESPSSFGAKTFLPLVSCLCWVGLAVMQGDGKQLQRQVWGPVLQVP